MKCIDCSTQLEEIEYEDLVDGDIQWGNYLYCPECKTVQFDYIEDESR